MRQTLLLALLLTPLTTPLLAGNVQGAAVAPVRVGGSIPPPQKVTDVRPVTPAAWQQQGAGMEGVVTLDVTIGEDGRVRDAVVTHSIPLLDQAALDAVRQWQYRPTIVDRRPVPVMMTVTVSFPSQRVPMPPATTPQPMIRLTSARAQDGIWMVWEIPPGRASGLPHWNPEAAPPSLPLAEAMGTARAWLMTRNPQMQRFELQSVTLSRVRRGEVDFWHYQIDFFGYGAAQQPGGPLFKAVILPDGSVVEPTQSAGDNSSPVPPGVYRPGAGVTMPRAIREVKPNYTAEALRLKISGSVFVEGVVGTDGAFHNTRVSRSLDAVYGLDAAALNAAAQWQFAPGTKDGQPVPVMVTIELTFTAKR